MSHFTMPQPPVDASHLPLTLMLLKDWTLVSVQGEDTSRYLQGQLTLDVMALAKDDHKLSAHCDPKGKMWSVLRLFHRNGGFSYLLRRSVRERQIAELKKYAVFSKVTISGDDDAVLLGIAGRQARDALASVFTTLPNANKTCIQQDETTLLWFAAPTERFLLITSAEQAGRLQKMLQGRASLSNDTQWLALEIEAGLPVIDAPVSDQLIPQAVNLQALDAISFKKGCYTGQEMVARARYRGANKRALYRLTGTADTVPAAGEALLLQMGENWRRTGLVLAAVRLENGNISVQVVLNNDVQANSVFRVKEDDTGLLTLQPLPYRLE